MNLEFLNDKEKVYLFNALTMEDKKKYLSKRSLMEYYMYARYVLDQETFDLITEPLILAKAYNVLHSIAMDADSRENKINLDKVVNAFLAKEEFCILYDYLEISNISLETRNKIKENLLKNYTSDDFNELKRILESKLPFITTVMKKEFLKKYYEVGDLKDYILLYDLCSLEHNLLSINTYLETILKGDYDKNLVADIILGIFTTNDKNFIHLKETLFQDTYNLIISYFLNLRDFNYLITLANAISKEHIKNCILGWVGQNIGIDEFNNLKDENKEVLYDFITFAAKDKAQMLKNTGHKYLSQKLIKTWIEKEMKLELSCYAMYILNDFKASDEEIAVIDANYSKLLSAGENNEKEETKSLVRVKK